MISKKLKVDFIIQSPFNPIPNQIKIPEIEIIECSKPEPIPIPNTQGRNQKRLGLGQVIDQKYSLDQIIGQGLTGQVVSGHRLKDLKPVAIKSIKKV